MPSDCDAFTYTYACYIALELETMEIISLSKSLLYILNLVVCWSGGGELLKTYCNYAQFYAYEIIHIRSLTAYHVLAR